MLENGDGFHERERTWKRPSCDWDRRESQLTDFEIFAVRNEVTMFLCLKLPWLERRTVS